MAGIIIHFQMTFFHALHPPDVDPSFSKFTVSSIRKCFVDPTEQGDGFEPSARSRLSELNSFLSPHRDSGEVKEDADAILKLDMNYSWTV